MFLKMFENKIYPVIKDPNLKDYSSMCSRFSWDDADACFSWHTTGKINIAHEAIDRHARDPETADLGCTIYCHGEKREKISYRQMRGLSNRFANVLKKRGIQKGDRVCLFLPSIPELYIALAGCAKTGAIIVPLYSNYRQGAVRERMLDAKAKLVVTDIVRCSRIPVHELPDLEHIIIAGGQQRLHGEDLLWQEEMADASEDFDMQWVGLDTPFLLIYTSGHDGSPVGLLHVHGAMKGYLMTARWVLDLKPGDVLWTQGRPGWFMNIVYSAFAPWLCGVENVVSGRIDTSDALYRTLRDNRVSVLYTIPSLYRMLVSSGEETAEKYSLNRLRHLLSVLEPLTPDVIYAVMRILKLPVYDTWWSAETGMITIANFPCLPIKPGYLGKPCPGIRAAIFDASGNDAPPFEMGELALEQGWPAMVSGIWGRDDFEALYLAKTPWFMTGDIAFFDHDNYFYYQGRADDVIITAAGKVGISEIERSIRQHPAVSDAAVIRAPDTDGIKKLKAFICVKGSYETTELLKKKIISFVQHTLSPDITPAAIEFCDTLPRDEHGAVSKVALKARQLNIAI